MRLIDADALKAWIESCTEEKDWIVSQYNADWIWSMLDSAPTIDAEPVVRCGRCKWGKAYKAWDGQAGFKCDLLCVDIGVNDFCSCGERRESNG